MSLFSRLFRVRTSPQSVNWGDLIYSHVASLGTDHKKGSIAERRGLAFGQIKVSRAGFPAFRFALMGEQTFTVEAGKSALYKALKEQGLPKVTLFPGFFTGEVEALSPGGNEVLSVTFNPKVGISEMESTTSTGVQVLVRMAEILGFPPGPLHYTHESPVPIRDIVVYATRWEDTQTGCKYLDVMFRPSLVKHEEWHAAQAHHDYSVGEFKGLVFGSLPMYKEWPKISINNKPVYSTAVSVPTENMLKAKNKFHLQEQQVCERCKKPATLEVDRVTVDLGDSHFGNRSFVCNDPVCLKEETQKPSVRHSITTFTPRVWSV